MVKKVCDLIVIWLMVFCVACSVRAGGDPNFITFSRIYKAWKYSDGKGVKIAILDWQFDVNGKGKSKYVDAKSFVNEQVGTGHPWHGEWMGVIVNRIAPKAKIIPLRCRPLSREGDKDEDGREVYEKYLIKGIRYAADMGAAAVTNSMGPVKHCKELEEAIDYAENKGTIFVDVHPEYLVYTRTAMEFCPVEKLDKRIIRTGIVSVQKRPRRYDPRRDIYVWPYDIDPVFEDGWGYSNGPPIVAGVIALIKNRNPKLTPGQVREIIQKTTYKRDGFNVLDAGAAMELVIKDTP